MNVLQRQSLIKAVSELDALKDGDSEAAHCKADDIIMRLLRENGYAEAALAFEAADDRCDFQYC